MFLTSIKTQPVIWKDTLFAENQSIVQKNNFVFSQNDQKKIPTKKNLCKFRIGKILVWIKKKKELPKLRLEETEAN